jgi:hypothetical protein
VTAITYDAPKTIASFMRSAAFFRLIVGPVGSGKTTGCIFELFRRAAEQMPGPDGIRRTRWAIVRQTLSQLKMTVLLDILSWFRGIATWKVSESLIIIEFGDIHCEIYLIPLEDPEDQKRLLSSQLTGAWISEAIEINPDLVAAISGRCGRYPSAADGGASWYGIIADTNTPSIGSDWWKILEEDRPMDWAVFFQPGGLEPDAENLDWLTQTPATLLLPPGHPDRRAAGRRYYERLARNTNKDWVDRYVHARYGEDPSGTAVWRTSFRRSFHVVRELEPVNGKPLLLGQDFGRNPCTLICQPDHSGRLLVLEEVISQDLGLETHILQVLKPRLWNERYMGKLVCSVGDPSGRSKGNIQEESPIEAMTRMGIPCYPAGTNNLSPRLTAVETLLLQQRDGGPALIIDGTRCPETVRAMQGSYKYGKTKEGNSKPLPDKTHPYSDLADDLQYVCLALNSGLANWIAKRIAPRQKRERPPAMSAAGWT